MDSLASLLPAPVAENKKYALQEILESVVPIPLDSESVGRIKVKTILNMLKQSKATCFVTSERIEGLPGYSRDTISEFLSDAVIIMHKIEIGVADYRTMEIPKFRKTSQYKDLIPFDIDNGIKIRENELRQR